MKEKLLTRAIWVLFGVLIFGGCASTGTIQPVKPLEVQLSNFKTAMVIVSSQVPECEQEKLQLETMIIKKLRKKGLFEQVIAGSASPEAISDLKLDSKIVEIKKVNAGTRAMLSALAGQGKLLVDVILLEKKSGTNIGQFTVEGKTSGGTIFAGTTEQAVERAAEQIVALAESGFKP